MSAVICMESCRLMSTRARQVSIWIWPLVAIVLVAVAGQVFGLLGAIITASSALAALLFTAAELLRSRRARQSAAVVAVIGAVAVMALFALQGVMPWSRTSARPGNALDLRGHRISASNLTGDLRGARLAGADLSAVNLHGRDLAGVDAPGTSLRNANLAGASLRGADLRGADLRGACLDTADLTGAELSGAEITGATIAVPPGTLVTGTPLPAGQRAPSCG